MHSIVSPTCENRLHTQPLLLSTSPTKLICLFGSQSQMKERMNEHALTTYTNPKHLSETVNVANIIDDKPQKIPTFLVTLPPKCHFLDTNLRCCEVLYNGKNFLKTLPTKLLD